MWKSTTTTSAVLIVLAFMLFSFSNSVLYIIFGVLILLLGLYFTFRSGQGAGHEACSVSKSIERLSITDKSVDPILLKRAWTRSNALRLLFAGCMPAYAFNCLYIIISLIKPGNVPVITSRIFAWLMVLPYWPILSGIHATFTELTPDVVALLMITPFVIPFVFGLGYLSGPKLWTKTEHAMAAGKRRAKARSRIVKNKSNSFQQPKI